MYGKCRDLDAARSVFNEMKKKDVVTWNSIISAYAQNGRGKEALELYNDMDWTPDKITYVGAIEACASSQDLEQGRMIHARIDKGGVKPDTVLENSILNMYWKCRSLDDAKTMFATMDSPSFVAWNIMILAYAHSGYVKEALETFQKMDIEGVEADCVSFSSALDACAHAKALEFGKAIHDSLGCSDSRAVCVNNALTNFYGRCGRPEDARIIFDQMPMRDVISWTAMISVYVETGFSGEALALYREMCLEGGKPNQVTLKIALDACAELGDLSAGKGIHSCILWSEETAPQVGNTLVNFYSRCGEVRLARAAFDKLRERDMASWTAMFRAYGNNGDDREVIQLFHEMVLSDELQPDTVIFSIALQSCANVKSLADGKAIHKSLADSSEAVKTDVVVCNTLLSMYAKSGTSADARAVFESMSRRNVITWNGIMKAYALQGEFGEALVLFQRLEAEKEVKPDRVTFVVAIDCCACKPCLEEGRRIHASVVASGLDLDLIIGNTLVNMYGKCGQVGTARGLFDKMIVRDVVTWSSLLATYASNGHGMEGLELFRLMQQDYTEPNEVTFLGVLFACSHLGFVRESKSYLFAMQRDYGLTPGQEHFSCVIDLLARSGRLDEAEELVRGLPFQPDNVIVTSLLGACTTQGDLKRGIRAAELVFGLDASDQVPYVLLWNIFAAAGHWDGVERVEKALGWRALEFT
ncbi:pentatricopeptide repeat-containing protein At3g09040, mitochondrial isoform X1 [Selaginella moellendorffii]|uniref:pentatricopeptide repeat-containing protein At3g09040, mitochondrial isoform X1 n=2 Tax=Selaginella moellendorffii TaxID=88036 RepID=UPI000D1CC7FE|nr:pentatricopeptide repeat-containing protein At3g09040, mitochondrial isoform X1 [Selaginella moellendorffii]|eukprot:XP_024535001.1 pentatricopeptide repeat-containing protein At3g09040, mitochondrial isoform X1 [Selaginella moellendorffii]